MSEYVKLNDGTEVPYDKIVDNEGAFVDVLMEDENGVKLVTECKQQKGEVTRFIIPNIHVWLPGDLKAGNKLQVVLRRQKDE